MIYLFLLGNNSNIRMEAKALQRCLGLLQRRWGPVFGAQVVNLLAYGSAALPQTQDQRSIAANTLDLIV